MFGPLVEGFVEGDVCGEVGEVLCQSAFLGGAADAFEAGDGGYQCGDMGVAVAVSPEEVVGVFDQESGGGLGVLLEVFDEVFDIAGQFGFWALVFEGEELAFASDDDAIPVADAGGECEQCDEGHEGEVFVAFLAFVLNAENGEGEENEVWEVKESSGLCIAEYGCLGSKDGDGGDGGSGNDYGGALIGVFMAEQKDE